MVDLAIASNFARELTEDQFTQERKSARRRPAARSAAGAAARPAAGPARVGSGTRPVTQVEAATRGSRARPTGAARSTLARLMSRLVQVRG